MKDFPHMMEGQEMYMYTVPYVYPLLSFLQAKRRILPKSGF